MSLGISLTDLCPTGAQLPPHRGLLGIACPADRYFGKDRLKLLVCKGVENRYHGPPRLFRAGPYHGSEASVVLGTVGKRTACPDLAARRPAEVNREHPTPVPQSKEVLADVVLT